MKEVMIWEEAVTIPTYEVGKPDKNPMFLEKRVYQGSTGKIYPYPSTNEISRTKTDKTWNAVFLENEYIRIMVLPELGGRIQRAYDKTNDYDFVYYNHVIKPALVGLTGPWISGGIEFNWPQHHRPTTYSPVDHKIVKNEDGSVSLLIGDVDQMYGTKVVTTFTLYPGKAYIEIKGQLYNRTPLPQTFLWWANPAVSVNEHTKSIFPPDVHNVYDHGKRAVSRFPIATGEYYKHDYSEGVDISRYKNIPVPTSYMAEKSDYDFVGGYDYQKKAGLLHVADHHISPGKKQWTWGCGDFDKAWDRNLTDEDGPYIELMTGMFCDNQPDFTWLKPYEEKVFKQYFMPYKAVGEVKNASIRAALNIEKRNDDTLYICAYATQLYKQAEIIVNYDGKDIYKEKCPLSPVDIYENEIPVCIPDKYKVKVTVSSNGKELVSYMPKDPGIPEFAKPATTPGLPKDIKTNEELYLTAQHIEQYRHATWLPDPYYLEGLERDPEDTRINNAYGLLLFRRGRFEESEKYFKTAIDRLTRLHPAPFYAEPFYNLGLSLFYQEKYDEAYDAFYKATWSSELQEMSFYYLACIEARKENYEQALDFVESGLIKNTHNIKARGLKAMLLHKLHKDYQALAYIVESLKIDTFDFYSRFVQIIITAASKPDAKDTKQGNTSILLKDFHTLTRDYHENFLMIARDLAESGFYEEAIDLLNMCPYNKQMLNYYIGAYILKSGGAHSTGRRLSPNSVTVKSALMYLDKADKKNPYCCFPNKLEDIDVLEMAIAYNPKGPKAYYYLGCLYYDKLNYEKAISLWEKSRELDDTFPTLLRNLSIAYYNKKGDKDKAKECIEKAFALDQSDARVFLEMDQLYQRLNVSLEERLKNYTNNIDLIEKRDDLYTEYVTLLNTLGMYEEALDRITSHFFQTWEGAEGKITAQYKLSLYMLTKAAIEASDYGKAKELLEKALVYPENLGEGKLEGTKDNNIYYLLALTEEKIADHEPASESDSEIHLKAATLGTSEPAGMMYYYDQPADMILFQGKAFEKLGDIKAANSRYYKLLDYGQKHLNDDFIMDYFAVSMPDMSVFDTDMNRKNKEHCYYLMGLAYLGLNNSEEADKWFSKVLELNNSHQQAALYKNYKL
ncbi:Tetratricopeptide repeat-containing protein [Butyrivibrio fibrisolvens DSM 3071]|uniref:Tetratricopeptide repeat-containing protein n=1 Tax=Butyrivibrio fibrisolvens DSM 3071 TaxID=1121131 RepID=A0A1M5WS38_BUTFI|nr:DUF5107 domain-containing protein [Butyrivibrio fibrisolvens]SHH90278.1 Tetratricopeptide repeat-containing protein [Butyrivibrio fibrisolvens DSM 3071]